MMNDNYYPFENTALSYEYNALEPYIDERTMRFHHDKHLKTYVDNLNTMLEAHKCLQKLSLVQIIRQPLQVPNNVSVAIKNNAGGVFNHRFFFSTMCKKDSFSNNLKLVEEIKNQLESVELFKMQFKDMALSVFGSGYAWLVSDRGRLRILKTFNQDTPISQNLYPILTIDVWEHAYYLKHQNLRANYIDSWFNVINWEKANENYINSISLKLKRA